ncbi:MAG TPA: ATP-dependent 6-phosphofructokinase [Anaerolineaceae bacterium]|nr:ATP-dependent 6-phosphofructokinase [Anaerolineaceae bacterium]
MAKIVGVLTAGGDTPGLNAALRGLGKSAHHLFNIQLIGFYDGFRGLMQDRTINLDEAALSGILTSGGTILGTSRDKPDRMPIGGKLVDMTEAMVDTYNRHHLDVLVCIGGGGTHKNAYLLQQKGLNVITMPKSIDNDVACTDVTIGFDTALGIATEAIDRLHSTAHSHHRIIVVELMGHNTGWLALGSGVAGGADVILIPEIPYETEKVADAIISRSHGGKRFSIVAVSEGAMSVPDAAHYRKLIAAKEEASSREMKEEARSRLLEFQASRANHTMRLAQELEQLTGLESRVTILGYVQRGGTPSSRDRLLATELGTATAALIAEGTCGVMVAVKNEGTLPVPLEDVVGIRKTVPRDHSWIETARRVSTCLGD